MLEQKFDSIFLYSNYIDNPYVADLAYFSRSLTVEEVMREEKVTIDDLSALMLKNLKLAAGDMFHWKPEGRDLQVRAVAESIGSLLKK